MWQTMTGCLPLSHGLIIFSLPLNESHRRVVAKCVEQVVVLKFLISNCTWITDENTKKLDHDFYERFHAF